MKFICTIVGVDRKNIIDELEFYVEQLKEEADGGGTVGKSAVSGEWELKQDI